MPTYLITAPDGRKFKVTGEGSRDAALAHIQSTYQAAPKPDLKAQDPSEYDPNSQAFQDKYGPVAGRSFAQNFTEGVGKSFVDTGRGVKQLAIEAGDKLGLVQSNIQDTIRGESATQRARREASENARMDAPLMHTGGGVTGYIGGQLSQLAIPGGAVPRAASLAGRVGAAAAGGALFANTQPVTSEQSRLGSTALGAAGGAAGELAAAGIGRLAQPSQRVTPEVEALARRAEELGIPLRAEQVSQSRPLAGISASLDAIPFSGRDASRQAQRAAFNRAVAHTLGEETDNVGTAVNQATHRLGARYDDILRNNAVVADNEFINELDTALQAARGELTDPQFGVIQRQVNSILDKVGDNNEIDGQAAYNIKKLLDRINRSGDSSLRHHAAELRDALLGALNRSLPDDVAQEFRQVRNQYSNLIAVRRLVRAGAEGNVTPAALGNVRNLRGELRDVANVGAQFLREPFGNSGTANRMIGAGLLGGAGVGALVEPTTLLAAGATAGSARGANALLQSQPVVNYLLEGSPLLQRASPYANALLPRLGAAGAIASQ